MSGESRPAQFCRRYNISSSLLYHWKRQYSRGRFTNEPIEEAALKDRIEKLERLVGRLILENEFLKRGFYHIRGSNCILFPPPEAEQLLKIKVD